MKKNVTSKSKSGKLSREDVRLWVEVTKTVTPNPDACLPELGDEQTLIETPPENSQPRPISVRAPKIRNEPAENPKPLPLAPIERRLRQRLSRGQMDIGMKLDLHGLRQAEAYSVLQDFLRRALQNDVRIVLVVTGKGKTGLADHAGVLRRMVPHWLTEPAMRHIVLGFEEASLTHGGSGALYVRLRSARRSGATIL